MQNSIFLIKNVNLLESGGQLELGDSERNKSG